MTRTRIVAAITISTSVVVFAMPAGRQQPTFRAGIDVVSVNAAVLDGTRPVTGLTREDFELTDNGVRQKVNTVGLDSVPLDVTVVTGAAQDDMGDQLTRAGVSGDEIWALLHEHDQLQIVDVGAAVVSASVARPSERTPSLAAQPIERTAGNSLNDALFYALARPVASDRRHLIVVFSDGHDTWSTLDADRLPAIAGASDAVLHAVMWAIPPAVPPAPNSTSDATKGTTGGVMPDMDDIPRTRRLGPVEPGSAGAPHFSRDQIIAWHTSYNALQKVVDRTGGATHNIANATFKDVLDDFRSSYVLHYTPAGVAPGGWHDIVVKIPRHGSYTIRARKGYGG